jgi:hypothetical protein
MAGVVPIVPPRTGVLEGKLDIQVEKFLALDDIVPHVASARDFLNEVLQKSWRYLFIDGYGRAVMELEVGSSPYNFKLDEHPHGGFCYAISVDFGRRLPKMQVKDIANLERFIVNICSKQFPRAVTVDLTKNEITYVHDTLWVSKGKESREDAKEVFDILRWLVDVKKFKLALPDANKKYKELVGLFGGKR